MSLINQMLKDLEAGRASEEKKPAILKSLRSVSHAGRSFWLHPVWLIVVSVILVVALISFFRISHAKVTKSHAQSKAIAAVVGAKIQPHKNAGPIAENQAVTTKPAVNVASAAVQKLGTQTESPAHVTSPVTLSLPKQAVQPEVSTVKSLATKQSVQAGKSTEENTRTLAQLQYAEVAPTVDVKRDVPMSNKQEVSRLYQVAEQALDSGDDQAAVAALRKLLIRKSDYVEARELLATVLLTDNNIEEADDVVNVGLKRMPHYAPFTNIKARIFMNQGQIKQAIDELNQAAPQLSSSPDYYALLAALYQQSEQFILSAQLYHQLVQLDPVNAVWWMGLGIALESAEKNNAALEAFQHAEKGQGLSATAKAYVQQQITKLS